MTDTPKTIIMAEELQVGKLLLQERGRLNKEAQDRLNEARTSLKEAQLNYLEQTCFLRLLRAQCRDNESLRERLGRAEAAQYKDTLAIEDHHWNKYAHSNDKEWKRERTAVLKRVSEMASEECCQIESWLNEEEVSSKDLSEAQLKSIPSLVREKREGIRQKEQCLLELKQKIHSTKMEHYKVLSECCQVLDNLISKYQVRYLASKTESNVDYLATKTQALDLKLKVIKLQLLVATYTPEKNAALKEIRSYLDSAHQQLELQLIDTQQSLEHYQSLGTDFMSLAEEYHQVMAEIENKKWALEELTKSQQTKS